MRPCQSYLMFDTAGQGALFPLLQLRKIAFDLPLTPVCGGPEAVKGVVNWQGRVIAAIDMGHLLACGHSASAGCEPATNIHAPLHAFANMIVGEDGRLYSLLVHGCGDILSLAPDAVEPLPMARGIWRDVADGIYRHNGSALPVLDAPRLVKHVETLCADWKKHHENMSDCR